MSVVLFFSKVNLNSDHIFFVYDEKVQLTEILNRLYASINEDVEYVREDLRAVEGDKKIRYSATYRFNYIEKLEGDFGHSIVGKIIKEAPLFFNKMDNGTGRLNKEAVDNAEIIDFYFDVHKEIVVFHTTNRFGHQEFNQAFGELLSICMTTPEEVFYFDVSLYKEGLSVSDLKQQLKSIGNLESLRIDIIPPNPDDELLDKIEKNGEKYLNEIKAGNVTSTSILFNSKSSHGLNLEAEIIEEQLKKIGNIHSQLSSEEAIQKGYVQVEATSTDGRSYTTNNNKPVKDKLDQKPNDIILYARACKAKVATLLRSLL